MTNRLAVFHTIQTDDVSAPRGRRYQESCWQVSVIVAMSLLVGSSALSLGHANDDVEVDAERPYRITVQTFDQMVFGDQQIVYLADNVMAIEASGHSTAMAFRERIEAAVAAEIEAVDRHVSLTQSQKRKLKLAARGDVEMFLSRADELRPKMTSKPMTPQQRTELMRELTPLQMFQQFAIIGEDSLFRKTLRGFLTTEQRVHFQMLERERQTAIVDTALRRWERAANGLRLTGEPRQKFTELILDRGQLPQFVGRYASPIVALQAERLRDQVKPLLTEAEWAKFEFLVSQAKGYAPEIKAYGLWTAGPSDDADKASDMTKE